MAVRSVATSFSAMPACTFVAGITISASMPFILAKSIDPGTAPGAGFAKLYMVAGTNAGSGKLIIYAGTSTTPVTIVDNVGSGF